MSSNSCPVKDGASDASGSERPKTCPVTPTSKMARRNSSSGTDRPVLKCEYGDYLQLNKVLGAQKLVSVEHEKPAHDEMLFIIIHQTYELWFKQILHELNSVMDIFGQNPVPERCLSVCAHRMTRVTEIQQVLISQIRILETMTPLDFLDFRNFLVGASGFQSTQFRLVENKLGLPSSQRLLYSQCPYYTHLPADDKEQVLNSEKDESLLQLVNTWLERTPFVNFEGFDFWSEYRKAVNNMIDEDNRVIDESMTMEHEDKVKAKESSEATRESFQAMFDEKRHNELMEKGSRRFSHKAIRAALLIYLYRDEPIFALPFRLLTLLVEIDANMVTWRSRHAQMVHRMIGSRVGTGGSSGYYYLRATAERHRIFPDLFHMATFLIPRHALPTIPNHVAEHLDFKFDASRSP